MWTPYRVQARNFSADSENRIHCDDVARQFGFSGALVGGVYVYGYMSHPLVEHLGAEWLARAVTEVTFFKPAYEGDELTIEAQPAAADALAPGHTLIGRNAQGVELARLATYLADPSSSPDPRAALPPAAAGERIPIAWDSVMPGAPLRALHWQPTLDENLLWCDRSADSLPIFRTGDRPPLHPGLMLQAANRVFKEHFQLNPWIHVSSRITHRAVLRVGIPLEVRAVVARKWRHKGHQFAELYVAMLADGCCAQEVLHQVIFSVRKSAA